MKPPFRLLASICMIVVLSSCASIVSKSTWPVAVVSNPSGLRFEIKNRAGQTVAQGTTPQTIKLASGAGYFKGESYTITAFKNGKVSGTTTLDARMNGWYMGNLAIGGLLGLLVVDPLTGAMYSLPATATIAAAPAESHQLQIAMLESIPAAERSKLVRI